MKQIENIFQERITNIQERITKVCAKVKRNPKDIKLILVTKTIAENIVQEALKSNQITINIGENKVQEALKKFEYLSKKEVAFNLHFIGHLQTNKIKEMLKSSIYLHSLDSINLAEKLEKRLAYEKKNLSCLLQVNVAEEVNKFGFSKLEVFKIIQEISKMKHLQVKGLMTMAPFTKEVSVVRNTFKTLKEIFCEVKEKVKELPNNSNIEMKELSMGMSNDFEIAIEEGATFLRIGSSIFGKRK